MPSAHPLRVLFISTDDSGCALLAEAILKAIGTGRFKACSACCRSAGRVNPFIVDLLDRNRLSVANLRGGGLEGFVGPGAPEFDMVIGLGAGGGDSLPASPAVPLSVHWQVPDPAAVDGGEEERRKAYSRVFNLLFHRLTLFVSLPFASLDRLALASRLADIGKTSYGPTRPRPAGGSPSGDASFHLHGLRAGRAATAAHRAAQG
jgi:protein-tyrosine-phosphatase